ncbi:hypothetical protein [Yinghuangia seranimata]|uniref:hypothetical protein n=1 Tax=Yinghuangia seranimata TaxID=408067 RepID=UPI00248AFF27|nr:hypothetical protein [Yinghuangia seranimata]MDI2127981.1 hypothetical protein [Yinghuangia seranimata]
MRLNSARSLHPEPIELTSGPVELPLDPVDVSGPIVHLALRAGDLVGAGIPTRVIRNGRPGQQHQRKPHRRRPTGNRPEQGIPLVGHTSHASYIE